MRHHFIEPTSDSLLLQRNQSCRYWGRHKDDSKYLIQISSTNIACHSKASRITNKREVTHVQRVNTGKVTPNQAPEDEIGNFGDGWEDEANSNETFTGVFKKDTPDNEDGMRCSGIDINQVFCRGTAC